MTLEVTIRCFRSNRGCGTIKHEVIGSARIDKVDRHSQTALSVHARPFDSVDQLEDSVVDLHQRGVESNCIPDAWYSQLSNAA